MKSKCVILALFCLVLLVLCQTAPAAVTDPNIITGLARYNCGGGSKDSCDTDPVLLNGGLANGVLTHIDRTFVFADANDLTGIDFVQTCVDDKDNPNLEYDVTVDKAGTLFLLIDNRVGDGDGVTPPTLGGGVMDWVNTAGFAATSYTVGIYNPADGSTVIMTAYALDLAGAGTTTLYAQNNGTSRLTYLIAAIPAGWNLAPAVTGVPANVYLAPGDTLTIDATVTDYGENTSTSVQWEQLDANPAVGFSPDATSEDVVVSFPGGIGDYTLRMVVTDGDGLRTTKTVTVSVKIPSFALEAEDWCTIANDSKTAPTSSIHTTIMDVKNYNEGGAQRRRVSYCQYDISSLKQAGKVFANSYFTVQVDKGNDYATKNTYVYAINEDLDDFTLSGTSWDEAPGIDNTPIPPLNSAITIETLDTDDLSPLLAAYSTPEIDKYISTTNFAALDEVLNADTDGTVVLMFITYDPETVGFEYISPSNSRAADTETGKKGIILRGNVMTQTWAVNPVPVNNVSVSTALSQLSWTNPPAVGDITCDVYLGTTEPNLSDPDYGLNALATGISGNSVSIPSGTLTVDTTYYWVVDVHDSAAGTTRGYVWSFNTENAMPVVEMAKLNQYLWLNNNGDPASATAVLDSTVTDDGRPNPPGAITYLWEQISGTAISIDPNNVEDITLALPAAGTYVFQLSASDGDLTGTATTEIYVGTDPCDAAQHKPNYEQIPADIDKNCYVDLGDLNAFVQHWLECNESMDAPCL